MSLFIQNNHGTINHIENSAVTIINGQTREESTEACQPVEDITPEPQAVESFIFTKKAQKESKEAEIILALQHSFNGHQDKARALVKEVRLWQHEGYIDSNYNARVMYDELNKIIVLPFQYGGFRKYYNE